MVSDDNQKVRPELGPLGETLLIPLYGRARESAAEQPLFVDVAASEIVERLDYDFGILHNEESARSMARTTLRTAIIDHWLHNILHSNPRCVVIELGCGLNTRFSRTDNGLLLWYNLDTPEVHKLWKMFFTEHHRETFLPFSAFDHRWMDHVEIPSAFKVVLISEASVIYFPEHKVWRFLEELSGRFPGGWYLFDSASQAFIDQMPERDALKHFTARFRWAEKHPQGWTRFLHVEKRLDLEIAVQLYGRGRAFEDAVQEAANTLQEESYYLNLVTL